MLYAQVAIVCHAINYVVMRITADDITASSIRWWIVKSRAVEFTFYFSHFRCQYMVLIGGLALILRQASVNILVTM